MHSVKIISVITAMIRKFNSLIYFRYTYNNWIMEPSTEPNKTSSSSFNEDSNKENKNTEDNEELLGCAKKLVF